MSMKRPLIFYCISLSLGCVFSILLLDSTLAAAAAAVFFLIILFLTLDIKAFTINVMFFLLGIFSFYLYFNITVDSPAQIRIVDKKGYYFLGDFKGRKLILKGETKGLEEGEKIEAHGKFQKNFIIENGVVGIYELTEYKRCKKDFVYCSYQLKKNLYKKFKDRIGEERAALVMGLCYGETAYISPDQMEDFQKLGIIHALSVSGFHMVIIYEVLQYLLGLKAAIALSSFYVFFTGMSAATVRSFIMILIFKLSKIFFKEYDAISSLSLAALVLMLFKPYYIVNLGFDLSFLATLGILLYNEIIYRKLYVLPEKLAESISLTFSSQIFSLPYIAFTIQDFGCGFVVGNLLLIPLLSMVIVLGNAALCLYPVEMAFKFACIIMNLVFTAVDGVNSIALKLCPEVVYLKYIDGLVILTVFVGFVMYKRGYEKFKYVPAICIILTFLEAYSIFTTITLVNTDDGEAAVVKKGTDRVMICNYDYWNVNWISNIKMQQSVNKIITNPGKDFICKLNENSALKIDENPEKHMVLTFCERDREFKFLLNKNAVNSSSYVIIFNMLFRIK